MFAPPHPGHIGDATGARVRAQVAKVTRVRGRGSLPTCSANLGIIQGAAVNSWASGSWSCRRCLFVWCWFRAAGQSCEPRHMPGRNRE